MARSRAVDEVSFTLLRGQVLGFLDPTAQVNLRRCGMLAGVLAPDAGRILIHGADLRDQPTQAKRAIGYLPEQPPLYREMTVDEQLHSGQTIQLRWRCGTDNGGSSGTGWRIDTVSITATACLCCGTSNSPPVLPAQTDRTVAELTTLVVTNTAADPNTPLMYTLLNPPTGAVIDANGVITWTPTEAQGPSTNALTTLVTDSGSPPLSATSSFSVVVTEVNSAPVLTVPGNQAISEQALWSANATAVDTDLPANSLTFGLVSGPSGLTVSSGGLISWTPTETQGPSTNTVKVRVFDNGLPGLSATNSFTITVSESNSPPVLPAQANRTIIELTAVTVTNTATDSDLPANTLTYSLLVAPTNAVINTNTGVITWAPTEAQGPTTNTFTTRVVDNGVAPLAATNTFTVVVNESNSPPVLPAWPIAPLPR